MKKLICITAIAGIMISSAAGAFAQKMTVDEAVDYALKNSIEFSKKDAEIRINKYTAYDASSAQKKLKKNPYLEVNNIDTYLTLQGYYSDAAKIAVTVAQRAEADLVKSVENSVKNDFYTYLSSLRGVEMAEENLAIAEENLNAAKLKKQSGTLSELDYKSFELAHRGAVISLGEAQRTCDYNLQKLKTTINYNEEDELIPVGEFLYEPTEPVDYKTAVEKSRKSNTYLNLNDSFNLAAKRWYWASRHLNGNTNAYQVEKATYDKAQADFSANVDNLDLNIHNMYNSLITLKEQIEYNSEYVDYLKTTADAMLLRYEMGVVTAKDYRQAQQEYFKAQNNLQQLELTYVVTNMSYELLFDGNGGQDK